MTTFVLASNNLKKLSELREILSEAGMAVISMSEAGIASEPEETGTTFQENALIKARAAAAASGIPAIADDSGLCVSALDGAPGVHSARFGGDGLSDGDRVLLLLRTLGDARDRKAKFICAVACVFPDGREYLVHGECPGEIAMKPRGSMGFGYDPVFRVAGTDLTMAEMSSAEKNRVSHRGKALQMLKRELVKYYVNQ